MFADTTIHGLNALFNHDLYGQVSGVIVGSSVPLHAPGAWSLKVYSEVTGMVHEVSYFNVQIARNLTDNERAMNLAAAHDHYCGVMSQYKIWADRINDGYKFW